jgi:hypothetical protein
LVIGIHIPEMKATCTSGPNIATLVLQRLSPALFSDVDTLFEKMLSETSSATDSAEYSA